jgi:hypothetical protein
MVQGVSAARGDSLRAAIDSVFARPEYQWAEVIDPWGPVRRAWLALLDAIDRLRAENPVAYQLLVWGLVAVLLIIVGHALWIAARTIRGGTERVVRDELPAALAPRDAGWYANEAQRLAASGRFVEAMQADFLRLMLELDGRRAVRFHPSKTPHEYLTESGLTPDGRSRLRVAVRGLYAHAFGRLPCDQAAWDAWRLEASVDRYAAAR